MLGAVRLQTFSIRILRSSPDDDLIALVFSLVKIAAVRQGIVPLTENDILTVNKGILDKAPVREIDPDSVQVFNAAVCSGKGLLLLLREYGSNVRAFGSFLCRQRSARQGEHQHHTQKNRNSFFHFSAS